MSATGTKLDRATFVSEQALATVRQVLGELGAARGLEELTARGPAAHLERELGLGSLERVELMLRLGDACGVRLPDRIVAEAETVQDLIEALVYEGLRENFGEQAERPAAAAAVAGAPRLEAAERRPEHRAELERQIGAAETLTEILRLRGLGEPARAHIHLYEEDLQPRTITFGELYTRASRVARELLRQGLEPGQTVAIMLPTCAEFFYTFAGILLAGGIPVPLYPPFRADRITEYATRQANILRNAESRFMFTFRQAEGLARLLQPQVPTLRGVLNAQRLASASAPEEAPSTEWRPVKHLSHQARGGDIAFLQYTSGSTGDPKGVTLTHANLLANIRSIIAGLDVRPADVAVSWLPLYHDMGLIGAWFVPLFSGNPVVVMSPLAFLSQPSRWLRAIHRHRGTMSPAPNFAYELCVRKIAEQDLEGLDLSSWRAALNGAEPVHAGTIERFAARFAPYGFRREAFLPVYGLAEASLAVSAPKVGSGYKVDRIERETFEAEGRAIPAARECTAALEFVSAGKPLPNVEVRIVANEGEDADERTEGRLWFRSPSATSGYYRNEAATSELVRDGGWLDSGDRAYLADGEIYITGRAKDVIIKAGRNLYPHEIEEIAGRVPGVRAGCVVAFGAPDARSATERLVVAAEVRSMAEAKRVVAEITREVDQAIGAPPDSVELLPPHSIPKTSSGKLRRSETRRLFLEGKLGKKAAPPWMQVAKLALRSAGPRMLTWLKRGGKHAGECVYGVCVLATFGVSLITLWLTVAVTFDRLRAARLTRTATRWMLYAAGIPVRIEGKDVLDETAKGACIFAPNHSSYVDVLVTLALLPAGVRFVAKGETLKMPLVGTIVRRTGQLAFDRSDPQERIKLAEEVDAALLRGESVAIYPEGTFTPTVGIRPFHLGAFKAATVTQKPICPVAIRGARQILRDGTRLPRPGRITVTFGPLVRPDPNTGDDWREVVRLRDTTREIIARNVGEPLL
ncbi:MAG: AMP-binding protein [Candidatus Acidiferrales bacterium]|jgi:1-acyl-sn-glycerol-3-phosphate acyltransferase